MVLSLFLWCWHSLQLMCSCPCSCAGASCSTGCSAGCSTRCNTGWCGVVVFGRECLGMFLHVFATFYLCRFSSHQWTIQTYKEAQIYGFVTFLVMLTFAAIDVFLSLQLRRSKLFNWLQHKLQHWMVPGGGVRLRSTCVVLVVISEPFRHTKKLKFMVLSLFLWCWHSLQLICSCPCSCAGASCSTGCSTSCNTGWCGVVVFGGECLGLFFATLYVCLFS